MKINAYSYIFFFLKYHKKIINFYSLFFNLNFLKKFFLIDTGTHGILENHHYGICDIREF
jgi:hypothetical protein